MPVKCLRLFSLILTALLLFSAAGVCETETEAVLVGAEMLDFLAPGSEPVHTENYYVSENVIITISSMRVEKSDVYVADIRLKDLSSFRRVFSTGEWKRNANPQKKTSVLGEESGSILAITGDNSYNFDAGVVIGNGKAYRTTSNKLRDICVLYTTGEMKTYIAGTVNAKELAEQLAQEAQQGLIWQTFLFGPALLDEDGHSMTKFNTKVGVANPRSVIGYYEPGHYAFIQVDGRGTKSALEAKRTNKGLTMTALSQLIEDLGLQCAYNLDGGQSSMLWFDGNVISTPYQKGRKVADAVVICEPAYDLPDTQTQPEEEETVPSENQ